MSDRYINGICVTQTQIDELAGGLFREREPPALPEAQKDNSGGRKERSAHAAEIVPAMAHLTDDQFIGYMMGALTSTVRRQLDAHIRVCPECSGELLRLRSLSAIWNEERQFHRLENRIRSLVSPKAHRGLTESFIPAFREGIRAVAQTLIRPMGAYAEGQDDYSDPLEFRIMEEGAIVEALGGTLQRKGEEYYILVQIQRPEERIRFRDRRVQVTLSDADKAVPILQRNIEVGVVMLLGAALPLTDTCYIEAQLLPLTEVA